jgi:eukaryotic-like serine/threonine-protein kinase
MGATGLRLPARYAGATPIAHGGMADVVRATDERLDRTVAIKVLAERYAGNGEFRTRFLREAQTAASLSNEPYVIAIYDVGEADDGLPFIVMEHLSGGTLADRLRDGPVEQGQALAWLAQAASALDAAHARGIVHRDVKPANLLVAEDGTIRVSDFGIARAASHDTLTAAGTVLGSTGYRAPEQARGEPSTAASDRYALACVAFELLTGRRPFVRETHAAEAMAHANEAPPRASSVAAALPPAVDDVLAAGLAKDPGDRPGSARELVRWLREALEEPQTRAAPTVVPPHPTESTRVVRHGSRPRRWLPLLVAAGLLAAGGLLAWALTSVGDEEPASTVVRTQTLQGETVVRTVTTEGQTVERTVTTEGQTVERTVTTEDTTASPPPAAEGGQSGAELNDRGFTLLRQGDVTGALPLLEAAVADLSGDGSLAEAFASYNLATARFATGSCDGVLELLDRSEQVQGKRREIDRLRKDAERRCEEGGGKGNRKE